MISPKPVRFVGDALDQLRSFPDDARRSAGFQIDRIQRGLEPNDWKPMPNIGSGAREIRVRERAGAFRIIYIAEWRGEVIVLHAFQKKSAATSLHDVRVAADRLKALGRD